MKLLPTASQTVGPFLHIGLAWLTIDRLAAPDCPGQHFKIEGRVLDGDSRPVSDALVEIWQADAHGRYAHPEDTHEPLTPTPRPARERGRGEEGFRGFGRVPTDADGRFRFFTIKPGPVADGHGGYQAPHLLVSVFMRGLLKRLVTRMYFPDEPRNADDRVLRLVPAERRATLVARPRARDELEWDILLQGPGETVFFDC
jgi:protocatechuate 3,4-dioxygenase alpha subunit